jgi:magnesium transporter
MAFELTDKFIKQIQQAADDKQPSRITALLGDLHPADISAVLHELDTKSCRFVFDYIEAEKAADILVDLDEDIARKFLEQFSVEELAPLADLMDSDDAADVLNLEPVRKREQVILAMQNKQRAAHVLDLLHYPDNCAGGLMAKELIRVRIGWNVLQCIEEIRRQAASVEKILSVYVVDDANVLLGRLSIKKLILSPDHALVKDIYEEGIVSVETYSSAEEVADRMQHYDLEAVPVVNVQGKLTGRITIDDVLDVITEQAEIDQQIMSGISEEVDESDSVWAISRARLPWLLIGMIGGLLGAQFMGFFERDLAILPAMAFFIPLITATGGNVGIQSSTLVVQSLANFSSSKTPKRRLLKGFLVALVNGTVIAVFVFAFNVLFADAQLAAVVSIALFSVVMLASFMGTITPLLLNKLNINPALASGPFITTANDLLGLAIYFMIARVLYESL